MMETEKAAGYIFIKGVGVLTKILIVIFFLLLAVLLIPRLFGCHWVTVDSGSMAPVLPVESICLVAPADTIEAGDIIAFQTGNEENEQLVLHRVVLEAGSGRYITKGDANEVTDETPVLKEQIIGTERFCIFHMAPLLRFLADIRGKIVVCCGFLMLWAVQWICGSVLEKRREVPGEKVDIAH